jgi:hypothetical protein
VGADQNDANDHPDGRLVWKEIETAIRAESDDHLNGGFGPRFYCAPGRAQSLFYVLNLYFPVPPSKGQKNVSNHHYPRIFSGVSLHMAWATSHKAKKKASSAYWHG